MTDRFDRAHSARMSVLSYIIEHGRCSTTQVADALCITVDASARLMRAMTDIGELMRHGSGKSISYSACSTTTLSAEDMRAAMLHAKQLNRVNEMAKEARKAAKLKAQQPGRYVHTPGHYAPESGHTNGQPLREQGGQGNLRRVFGIQSSAGML